MRRVVNQQSVASLGVDSVAGSGAPPPGYTSQRDTASSIAVINDDEEDVILKNSPPPPPSMESPYGDPLHTLPSPYSNEDLRVRSHEQVQNPRLSLHPSCTHKHTHTHSQCTPVRQTSYYPPQPQLQQQQRDARPLSCDALHFYSPPQILSTDNLFGATNEQSRPYYQYSTEEHWQPSVQAGNQHQHQQQTSPYADYGHHQRQNTYPPPLRILTYPSTEGDYGCKEYGNEEEGNQSSPLNHQNMMMMMNSTATILSPPEEPLGYQSNHDLPRLHRRPSLPNGPTRQSTTTSDVIAMNSTKTATKKKSPTAKSSAKAHSMPPPLPLTQTQATNYVHLSRKCNPSMPTSKFRGWRRKTVQPNTQNPPPPKLPSSSSSSSAITGTFIINPELYIPPSLLNAMEDPVFFRFKPSSDTGETRKRKGSRKTNLRLEVENGGIDVDIRLVPTTISTNVGEEVTCTGNRGQQDTFCDTPVQVQASASTSTTAFSGPPSTVTHARQSTSSIRMQENLVQPSGGTSSRKGTISTPEVTHTSSRRDKKKPSRPTTIDLRIKQAYQQGSLNIQDQDSVKINEPIAFPLIARIHAPNPRPPFHLFASTIDIPTNSIRNTDSTSNQHTSPPREPQVFNTRNQSCASTSNRTTIQNSQVSFESTPIINSPPPLPLPLPRHRTRRSLSKYRPQRVSVTASSHGHGVPPTGSVSHTPSSSLTLPSQLNLASSSSPSSSSSPLYLHLPRTFRGPLTIHVSSGHISDRLRLSEGLEREVALIRESEFSRGYFVGGLGWDNNNNNADADRVGKRFQDGGGEEEEEMVGDGGNDVNSGASGGGGGGNNRDQIVNDIEKMKKTQVGNNPNKNIIVDDSGLSSSSSSSSESASSSPAAWKGVQGEWYGDRIEILVGSGDVYLQFEEEEGSFFRTKNEVGFWKRFFFVMN